MKKQVKGLQLKTNKQLDLSMEELKMDTMKMTLKK